MMIDVEVAVFSLALSGTDMHTFELIPHTHMHTAAVYREVYSSSP